MFAENSPHIKFREPEVQRELADRLFAQGDWQRALDAYRLVPGFQCSSVVLLRMAECHFNLKRFEESYCAASQAREFHRSLLKAVQIQSWSAYRLGRFNEWVELAEEAHVQNRDNAELRLDYAQAQLFGVGDAKLVRTIVEPLLQTPAHAERAHWLRLMSLLYDRPASLTASQLTQDFHRFSSLYMAPYKKALECLNEPAAKNTLTSKRIGFLCVGFASESEFGLTIKVMQKLQSQGHELTLFARALSPCGGLREFSKFCQRTVDCTTMGVPELNRLLASSGLDELYDMCGWMDTDALKALTNKPAERIYKWIGGQVCSTGLDCFDGFLTDQVHTPSATHALYTEPLISFGAANSMFTSGVSTLPGKSRQGKKSLAGIRKSQTANFGVFCAPAYISEQFLVALDQFMKSMPTGARLVFVDKLFAVQKARKRISEYLEIDSAQISFVSPSSQREVLEQLNSMDLLIDTFPHSCGAVILEARQLGVPVHLFPFDRQLFCERQALAFSSASVT